MPTFNTQHQPDQRKRTVKIADRVWYKNGANPFISMLKGKGKTDTSENQKIEWTNDKIASFAMQASPYSESATAITVASGANALRTGDILYAPDTGEQMRVSAVTNDTSVKVTRGYGEIAATAGTGTPVLQLLSTGFGEGTNSPDGTIIDRTENFNYCQIFKHSVDFTRNELKSPRYGEDGDKRKERRSKIMELHKRTIERQLLFGQRHKGTDSDGKALYISGGLLSFIKTNRINITGEFNIESLNTALAYIANAEASGDKLMLCGSDIMNAISKEAFGKMHGGTVVNKYGVDVTEIITAYGKIQVVYHPVISQVNPKTAVIIDMDNVKYTTIDDTEMKIGVEELDYDGVKDMILTDASIQIYNEETHAIISIG